MEFDASKKASSLPISFTADTPSATRKSDWGSNTTINRQSAGISEVARSSACIGFVAGEAVVFWMSEYTDANFLLFGAIGMVVSIAVAWLLSLGSYVKK